VPVVREDVPQKQQVTKTLNAVSQALTTSALSEMVKKVDEQHEPEEAVAEQFLQEQGLA
jgi:glycine betaine/choline ABC-type transport system substrate-binding protein